MRKVMLLASKDMCDILRAALNDKYITLPCSDIAAGRELLQLDPDVLILDLFLPGANGLTFLRENVNILPPVIIVLTRFLSDYLLQELDTLGVAVVIRVPYQPEYLI